VLLIKGVTTDALTAKDLVPALDMSERTILRRAARENWQSRPRTERGGGREWLIASMPAATRMLIGEAIFRGALAEQNKKPPLPAEVWKAVTALPALPEPESLPAHSQSLASYSTKERAVAIARLALIREVESVAGVIQRKEKAVRQIVELAKNGNLAEHLQCLVSVANNRFGKGDKRGLTRRTLYRWGERYAKGGLAALVPHNKQPDNTIPAWVQLFMQHYQRPQKPSLALAYRDFCTEFAANSDEMPPSIFAVGRFLKKWSMPELQAGRLTGNALLKLRPHKRRDTSEMEPGDVYTADGTTFDAEILHPYNGQPFKPEITCIVDVATRRVLGISAGLAENKFTVLDALRLACLRGGIPAMFYTDNGPGYRNNLMEAPDGMLARLGIEMTNSIPGRPQGKGLMERAIKTLCEPVAKRFATCTHRDMDRDAAKKVFKITRAQVKKAALERGLLPTWEEFKSAMVFRMEEYNNTPHRALPKITDEQGKRRHMSPNEMWQHFIIERCWEPVTVKEEEKDELFMPSVSRKVRNGVVEWLGNSYYAEELTDFHGCRVDARYDIWDASYVVIFDKEGHRICKAEVDGNKIPYFPKSQIAANQEKREIAQLKRIASKLQLVRPGATVALPIETVTPLMVADSVVEPSKVFEAAAALPAPAPQSEPDKRPAFMHDSKKFEWLMRHPEQQTDADKEFLAAYAQTKRYKDFEELYEIKGIAYKQQTPQKDAAAEQGGQ
jgi:putative transposase